MAEARDIAKVMAAEVGPAEAPRMLLEFKYWNFDALAAFLNRFDAIVRDREVSFDPSRATRSMLMGPRESVLAELRSQRVGYIAAWSTDVRNQIEQWGLDRFASVGTYTIYRMPRDP